MKMVWQVLPKGQKPTAEQWELSVGKICILAGIEAEFVVRDAGKVRNFFLNTLSHRAHELGARLDSLSVKQRGEVKDQESRDYKLEIADPDVPLDQRDWPVDCHFTSERHEGKFGLYLLCHAMKEVDVFRVDIEPMMFYFGTDRSWPDMSWARDVVSGLLTSFARDIQSDFTLLGEDSIPILKYDYYTDTLFLATDNA